MSAENKSSPGGHAVLDFVVKGSGGEEIDNVAIASDQVVYSGAFGKDAELKVFFRRLDLNSQKLDNVSAGSNSVYSTLGFDPQNTILAAAGLDGRLDLYDPLSWRALGSITFAKGQPANGIAVSTGPLVAVVADDKQVYLVSPAMRTFRAFAGGKYPYHTCAFSADAKLLAVAGRAEPPRFIDTATGVQVAVLSHREGANSLAFNPDASELALATPRGKVMIFGVLDQLLKRTIAADSSTLSAVRFTLDGKGLLTGGREGVRLWDLASGKEIDHFHEGESVSAMALATNGRQLVVGLKGGDLAVWTLRR